MVLFLCLITEGNDLDDLIDDNVEGEEEEEEEAGEQKEKKKKKRKRSELVQAARCPHKVEIQRLAALNYSYVVVSFSNNS